MEKDDAFVKFNKLREQIIGNADYMKIYDEARGLHRRVLESLYKFYLKHEDEVELLPSNHEVNSVLEVKTIDLTDNFNNNFISKVHLYLGKYHGQSLIQHVINNGTNDVKLNWMFNYVKKSFYSIFEIVSATPELAIVIVRDMIRGGEYTIVDRTLSIYAGIDEYKNNYYICAQLTQYETVFFFDCTVAIDKDNKEVIQFIEQADSDIEQSQIAIFCLLHKTKKVKFQTNGQG